MTAPTISGKLDALEDSLLQAGRTPAEVRIARRKALESMIEDDDSPETPGESNLNRARAMFVQPSDEELVEFFGRRNDVLYALLGEVYVVDHYDERKRNGEGRDGPRAMPFDANLDKLWDITTPRYSMQPFGVAVKELIGERSLRQFAAKVPMDHRELSRMMRGSSQPSLYTMEQIAKVGRVNPAFFLEYRIEQVTVTLSAVFKAKPNLSVGVWKRLRGARDAANARSQGRG